MAEVGDRAYLKHDLARQDEDGCIYILPARTELTVLGVNDVPWQPEKLFVRAQLHGADYFYTEPFHIYGSSVTL